VTSVRAPARRRPAPPAQHDEELVDLAADLFGRLAGIGLGEPLVGVEGVDALLRGEALELGAGARRLALVFGRVWCDVAP
jgi:hypothetical protein